MGAAGIRSAASVGVMSVTIVCGVSTAPAAGQVRVALQNPRIAPADVVSRAQAEVTRLFAMIDVEVVWLPESLDEGQGAFVVKITSWEPSTLAPRALGVTYHGEHGTSRAYVIWPRVHRTALKSTVGLDSMLAVAIAHELGHVLLPDGSHSKHGLMRRAWDENDLRLAAAGLLHFSRDSAVTIAHRLKSGAAIAGSPRR